MELWTEEFSMLSRFLGEYHYGGKDYKASASSSGSSLNGCRSSVLKALKVNESTCTHMKCTFGGVWNGGGGDGQKNLFVASFFFDRAAEVRSDHLRCLTCSNIVWVLLRSFLHEPLINQVNL